MATAPLTESKGFTRGGTSEVSLDQFNQALRSSHLWMSWMGQRGKTSEKGIKLSKSERKALESYLEQNGVQVPKDFHVDESGNLNQKSTLKRNLIIAGVIGGGLAFGIPAIMGAVGTGAGAGGVAGAAPALGGGGTLAANLGTASALPAMTGAGAAGAAGAGAAGTAAATGGGSVAGTVGTAAGGGGGSLWGKLWRPALELGVPAVTGLIGTKMAVDAQKDAAEIAAEQAEKALEWSKQQYETRRRDLAPAINVGGASTTRLADLMGLNAPEGGWSSIPDSARAVQPPAQAVPRDPAARNPAQAVPTTGSPGMVRMRSPQGQIGLVPEANVQAAVQAGGQVVG